MTEKNNLNINFFGADALRAIACLWVFAHHISPYLDRRGWSIYFFNFLDYGKQGVAIFFVLSGFLLSLPFISSYLDGQKYPPLRKFILRRIARIVPAYYVCIIILVLLNGLYHSNWEIIHILLMFSFSNTLIYAMYAPSFNTSLWTIPVEMHFYIILPIFMKFFFLLKSYRQITIYFAAIFIFIALGQYLYFNFAPNIEKLINDPAIYSANSSTGLSSFALFAHFLIGVLTALIFLLLKKQNLIIKKIPGQFTINSLITFCICIILSSFILGFELLSFYYLHYSWPIFPIIIGILLLTIPQSNFFNKISANHFFKFTATLSYGIYLWHKPIIGYIADYLNIKQSSSITDLLILSTTSLIASYLIAFLSYHLVEKYFINFAKKLT